MAQLEFRCERCGKLLKVDATPGSRMTCSHCHESVTVPNVQSPRPAPQVMGGVRPQPVAMAGAGPTPPASKPSALSAKDEPAEAPSSALAAMSVLMPWAVSIVFHIAFLLVMMFFTFLVVSGGQAAEGEADPNGDKLEVSSEEFGDSDNPGSNVVTKFEGIEPYGPGKDKTDFTSPATDLLESGAGPTNPTAAIGIITPGGKGVAGGGGEGTAVSIFGAGKGGGRGSRFFGSGLPRGGNIRKVVYVVDNSGSMFETFAYVKAELWRSINNLRPQQQYSVVFFADGPPIELMIDGQVKLQNATDANKKKTKDWIDQQIAASKDGKTDPRPSLERAFKIAGGPPELVYLLTDGMFDPQAIQLIGQLNFAKKVHVNTIAFRDRVGEELMQKIAKENAGNYTYISPESLGSDY